MITSIVNIDDISRINWIITIVMKVIPSGNDYQFAIKICPVKIVIFPHEYHGDPKHSCWSMFTRGSIFWMILLGDVTL